MIREMTDFKELLGHHLIIDDWDAVDLLMAIALAHKTKGNMIWLRLIGASGSGKTEILRTLLNLDEFCTAGESFTPSAIRRGYKPDDKELPRMLERWNGKLVITKEFAPMLTKKPDERVEVFGLLRSVWDGSLDADYGSLEGHIHQKTHFDWILGSTGYIEQQRTLDILLGSRFIDLHWNKPNDRLEAARKAVFNDSILASIQYQLAESLHHLIRNSEVYDEIPNDIELNWVVKIADVVCKARSVVYRDGQHEVLDVPETEMPTRLSQAFVRVIKGLYGLNIRNYKHFIRRLAFDCIPRKRYEFIKGILNKESIETVSKRLGVTPKMVYYIREDLEILNVTRTEMEIFREES